jgi:hypothetical protein
MSLFILFDWLQLNEEHFSLMLLLAALSYGVLGIWFPSTLVWVFALLSLGGWLGLKTGYLSGWGAYYLGMSYPLQFFFFGTAVAVIGPALLKNWPSTQGLQRATRAVGLLYLFIALWLLSIFGNYMDGSVWFGARRAELLLWSLLFAGAAIAAIVHGVKYDDGMSRGFGLTFVFINLYTRYFEYFWHSLPKALFFGLLAISFWVIGKYAESLWQLRWLKQHKTAD